MRVGMHNIDIQLLANVTGGAGTGFNTGITGGIPGINNKVPPPPKAARPCKGNILVLSSPDMFGGPSPFYP